MIFVNGAWKALAFMAKRPKPGYYTMQDLIGGDTMNAQEIISFIHDAEKNDAGQGLLSGEGRPSTSQTAISIRPCRVR